MAKKKTTVGKVKTAVVDAAAAVGTAAKKKVVKPVAKALGLTPAKKKPAAKKAAAKKPAAKKK